MTGNRIYVAAPWKDRNLAANIAADLEYCGYIITQKWWIFEGEEENTSWDFKKLCATLDAAGVRTADAVVMLNTQKSEGKAVEMGLAIAYQIPIVIIGDKEKRGNIFQTMDCCHWVPDVTTALKTLEKLQIEQRKESV